ncbi:coiled-coil domain-containing protein R3HCC1L [Panicum miliaceum]|uniref:Coiled-coil domain-containing protein R3HCC1L n=1 Tax=Panicum miliaceum TaxID=4540 RepID=A0A3L6SJZ5_PANMI|nr:coiled-coil domain-containing protein R3HCC1L [Panicum miliaceum]
MDGPHWTEEVDDLVDAGDVDGAIALLESVVSNLSTSAAAPSVADLRIATALGDLAGLHASCGNTLRADELRARTIVLRSRAAAPGALGDQELLQKCTSQEGVVGSKDSEVSINTEQNNEDEEDDWEAIADSGALDDTLVRSLEQEARVPSCSSLERSSTPSSGPKRRGRGSFLYDKSVLYSDQCGSERDLDDKESSPQSGSKGHVNEQNNAVTAARQFGTRHVLVLYDFSPSTRTTDLERIFEKFGDHGVAIHWVNDTSALAVFRTPSAASEAQSCIPPRYKVRSLKENDDLLTKIDGRDLEPPKPRPKTSARTAQRLIAHGMGLKQFTNFGSDELKKQEEERKNRIAARQAMRDEAWGSD